MEHLTRLASSLQSSVSSTVFSTVSVVNSVLPGNPVTREFEATEHIASAGPGLIWKVYSGFKKSTKQPAAVFVLEKRALDRFERHDREFLLELYKKAIAQLTRLRHPQILTVQHPLEESRDCLAFATEPVYCSLANALGRWENMPQPVPKHIREYKLFDVEIKYGLLQLSEGLHFLHDSVKMLHRNLGPESIILNHQGAWKIFGFDFCVANCAPANQPPSWPFPEYNHGTPPEGYPDLDFLAPEYALESECTTASDMFSLGMVAFALYNTKPLFVNSGNWGVYKRNASELKSLRESNLQLIPADLKEYLKMLMSAAPTLRPDAAQFAKIGYFDDIGVKTLGNLDTQFQWDNLQKSQFYKGLPSILPKLPHRVALHRVVPCLAKEFVNPHMVPFVLPAVLMIAEEASAPDFVQHVLPELKPVMKMTDPIQVLLIFMQRMDMLLSKTPPTDVKNEVLPMIYRALESDASQIQELCLSILPGFAGLLDYQAMKNSLLPRIKKLCVATTLLSVRVNSLICLGKLLTHLDKWLVIDEILPLMQQIPSREPAVIMGIVGIYKMTVDNDKLGLTKEAIATKVLPFLFPLSIENGLSPSQYSVIMSLVRQLVNRVEEEHRAKLEQLHSIQDEQKAALQISMSDNLQTRPNQLVSSTAVGASDSDDLFAGLGLGDYVAKKDTGAIATGLMSPKTPAAAAAPVSAGSAVGVTQGLSLEEKRRMAMEAESMQRYKSQSAVRGTSLAPAQAKSTKPKDLTDSLMSQNLGQMRVSQSMNQFPHQQQSSSSSPSMMMGMTASPSMSATPQWGNFSQAAPTMLRPPIQVQQQAKPSMSAFDSLLSMPSQQQTSMNAMKTPMMMPATQMSAQPTAKPTNALSASDISDFLS